MVVRQRAGPAKLIMGLHLGGMAEHEVDQCRRGRGGIVVPQPGLLDDLGHPLQRLA